MIDGESVAATAGCSDAGKYPTLFGFLMLYSGAVGL